MACSFPGVTFYFYACLFWETESGGTKSEGQSFQDWVKEQRNNLKGPAPTGGSCYFWKTFGVEEGVESRSENVAVFSYSRS